MIRVLRIATLLLAAIAASHAASNEEADPEQQPAIVARPQQMFVGLAVADLKRSQAWYQDLFGMRTTFSTAFDGGAVAVVENDWLLIELMQRDDAKSLEAWLPGTPNYRVHGVFKLGLFVGDLDATLAAFARRDVKPDSQIYVDQVNKTRNVFIKDPDGHRWQLFQRTP